MPEYYLDMETTGINPRTDKIITIQFQKLSKQGVPEGELSILKEWESSEKEIVSKFDTMFTGQNIWDFIPVGKNLLFDFQFLQKKFETFLRKEIDLAYLYNKPWIDVKTTLILMNDGNFMGYNLLWDQVNGDGKQVPMWYQNKEWGKIEVYIRNEASHFVSKYQSLRKQLISIRLK